MSRPVQNKSVFWSKDHETLLIFLAFQVQKALPFFIDIDDLIIAGWYSQARYYQDLRGKSLGIKREMFKYAFEIARPVWWDIKEFLI
jgi:hypothetical protein